MSGKRIRLGLLCTVLVATLAAPAQADEKKEEKKIVLDGKFGQIVSNVISKPGSPADLELGQEVRVDTLASADPDWDGATVTIYEQNLSYPSHGSYRSYGLIHIKTGDIAYVELVGKWDVVTRDGQFVTAPFEAAGQLVGGTGKLEGISGPVVVKGQIDRNQGGKYSAEITASR